MSKSLPRHSLAIDLLETMANLKRGDNDYETKLDTLKFNLSDERRQSLKYHAYLDEDEIDSVIKRASAMPGGQAMVKNLLRAVTDEISTTVDPRDLSIVLKSYESPRFRLPALLMSKPQPIIMIAGGTGISPFRGLFLSRYRFMHYNYITTNSILIVILHISQTAFWQQLALAPSLACGNKHLLIIGQRTRKNMAFEDEILSLVKANVLDVEIMFSADACRPIFSGNEVTYQDVPGRLGYVDKLFQDNAFRERVSQMIQDNAFVYLCGTGALARTALDALDSSLCDKFGKSQGKEILEKMVAENRMVRQMHPIWWSNDTCKPICFPDLLVLLITCYSLLYFHNMRPGARYIHQPKATKDEGGDKLVGAVPMQRFCWATQRRS